MRKYSRIVAVCLIVVFSIGILLTGCGVNQQPANQSSTPSSTTSASSSAGATSAAPKEKTKITFWQFWDIDDSESSIMPAIQKFNDENPYNIVVEPTQLSWDDGLTRIQTAIGAGTAPDVLELGSTWVGGFIQLSSLSDLSPYIGDFKQDLINWELGEKDGKTYAVPWAVGSRALAINHDVFNAAGLDPKKPPKDWNEMLQYAKTIKEKTGLDGFNITVSDPTGGYQLLANFIFSAGGNLVDMNGPEGKPVSGLTSDPAKKALDFLVSMKPYSLIDTLQNAHLAFCNDTLGMYVTDAQVISERLEQAPGKEFSLVPIPNCPDTGMSKCFLGAEVLTIPEQSKNKEAAIKFIQYLASAEGAMKICELCNYNILPSTSNLAEEERFKNPPTEREKYAMAFVQVMKEGKVMAPPLHPEIENIGMTISAELIDAIFASNVPADKALTDCEAQINKLYLK